MSPVAREFQVFVKPAGAVCNLACRYCYYLEKRDLYPGSGMPRMPPRLLERYVVQHLAASAEPVVTCSWHGGEPTLLGIDFFREAVALQRRHAGPGRRVINAIQTNGVLIDEAWCRFFAAERFRVGLSLDGPADVHDPSRVTRGGEPTHARVMRAFELLLAHRIPCDVLCAVHRDNVGHPTRVYRFFKKIGARYLGFLPVVGRQPPIAPGPDDRGAEPAVAQGVHGAEPPMGQDVHGAKPTGQDVRRPDEPAPGPDVRGAPPAAVGQGFSPAQPPVTRETVPPDAYGEFLCTIFDEWRERDRQHIAVQLFDEALRPALGVDHSLCIFRKTCGEVPVVEHNGDFYACDHFVDPAHRFGNILETPLADLLDSPAQRAFGDAKRDSLPGQCRACEVLPMCNGGCPKDRFARTEGGEAGLNYLCPAFSRFFRHVLPYAARLGAERRPPGSLPSVAAGARAGQGKAGGVGRNDPCPCGSGKKYKKCCLREDGM